MGHDPSEIPHLILTTGLGGRFHHPGSEDVKSQPEQSEEARLVSNSFFPGPLGPTP